MKGAKAIEIKSRTSKKLIFQITHKLAMRMKISYWHTVMKKFSFESLSIYST